MENLNFNVDPSDLPSVTCSKCEGENFSPTFIIKKVSALQSPTGEEVLVPVQLFKCDACQEVLKSL
jgi:hypothetical protein